MEQQKPHVRYDEFATQFTSVLHQHWSDILLIVNRQSPRVATLLRASIPSGLRRMDGTWCIRVVAKRAVRRERLNQPHDNEIVAQAIRLWAHSVAQLKLPRVTVDFES